MDLAAPIPPTSETGAQPRTVRIGMLTPSSNSVLEPYTSAMMAAYGERASAHFGRFRVTEISMSEASRSQFSTEAILQAARLLADARVDVMAWNGTSAGWLGFERDEALCAAITDETGIPATSTILALNEALALMEARTLGLVTPYLSDVQNRIIANYAEIGIEIIADRRLEVRDNFAFSETPPAGVAQMIRQVARSRPQAVAVLCTNFRGAPVAAAVELETGIPVLDSVAVTVWSTVLKSGLDPSEITGWGRLFQDLSRRRPHGPANLAAAPSPPETNERMNP